MPHQNTVFRQITNRLPWGAIDALVTEHRADKGVRSLFTKDLLLTLLFSQLSGAESLREIVAFLESHDARRYHSGLPAARRSTLADALAVRPVAVFSGVLAHLTLHLTGKLRRSVGECVRLIDSTAIRLNPLTESWARFSDACCGVKAHVVYDPDADCPLYLGITPSRVNDITAAQSMPIDPGATYVFDLGYYDFTWWAKLDKAKCRIVTRLKKNTPLQVIETLSSPQAADHILSDRIGFLPERQAGSRRNPMGQTAMREVKVRIDTGKIIRIMTNDLDASATDIADLYKRRWNIELFFRWIKQSLKLRHYLGVSENAIRIQITVALIAFVLLRLAHAAQDTILSMRIFARVVRTAVLHRKRLEQLGKHQFKPKPKHRQIPDQGVFEWA